MSDISLGRGIRQNLFSLQQSSDLIATTQNRLATGKKVNSAIDNPTNFFTAQSLNSRAKDLNGLLDGISNSLKTVEAADNGIRSITKLVENAQSVARQARALTAGGTTEAFTVAAAGTGTSAAIGAANKGQISLAYTPTGGSATNLDIVIGGGKTFDESIAAINDSSANRDASGTRIVTASKDATGKLVLTARNGTVAINATQGGGVAVGTIAGAGQSDDEVLSSLGVTSLTLTSGGVKLDSAGEQRQTLAKQFNDIREQITKLARDSGYNGVNLLNSDQLTVAFNERTDADKAQLTIKGTDFTAGKDDGTSGLRLAAIDVTGVNGLQNNSSIDDVDSRLNAALASLRSTATTFGSQLAIVQTRKDFTNELVNTLKSGADGLVLANSNEEAANLLTLQTRQQLSSQALALASQQEQSVLRLLG
jgi:flagellin-like hook-associated protein FlgL